MKKNPSILDEWPTASTNSHFVQESFERGRKVQNVVVRSRADGMKRRITSAIVVIAFLLTLGVSKVLTGTWAIGYFKQVTTLKGTVLGSDFPVPPLFRWFRQSVVRPPAKLMLYAYCWPCDVRSLARVKTVLTGADGRFDFGLLKPGDYHLRIDEERVPLSDWFEGEVKGQLNSPMDTTNRRGTLTGGPSAAGSTGQAQTRSGNGELGGGLVWYASHFAGTGCAKIQNALNAANGAGWVFADLTGTINCSDGISLSPGAWLYLPSNLYLNPLGGAGTGSGIYLSLGSHLICGGTNPSAGTIITAGNGFNRPMITIANAGHWTEVTNCRLEGNRAGQASATIAAAPTGASRTSTVATIRTTAAHGLHVNDTVYVDGVTGDLGFNGYWTVASVPTSTTFTYSNPGSNGTAGSGTVTGATDGLYMYQVGENVNIHHNYMENTSGSCYHIQGNMSPSGGAKSNACFDSGRYVFDFDGANGDFHIEDGSDDGNKGVFRFKQVTAYLKVTIDRMKNDTLAATVPNWMVMDGGAGHVYCKHCVIATGGSVNGADGILIKSPTSDGSAENYWEVELDNVEYVGGTGAGQINNIINSQGFLTVPYTQFNTNAGLATRIIHFYFGGEPWTSGYNGSGLLPEFVNILENATVNGTTESPIMYSALTRLTSNSSAGACDTFNGMSAPAMEGHTLVVHNPYNCAWTINEEDVSQATPANRIRTGRGNVTLHGISWATFTYLNPIQAVSHNGFRRSSNVVTVTLPTTVLYRVGDNVTISGATGCATSVNGTFTVASLPTNTTFTFSQRGGNETCGGAAATTSLPRWWLTGTYPASAAAITGAAVTVGNLPICNASSRDQIRIVTDARAPAWNTTVVGGGAVRIPVYCNGTNWVAF